MQDRRLSPEQREEWEESQRRSLREWACLTFLTLSKVEKENLCQWIYRKPFKQWRRCKALAEAYYPRYDLRRLEAELHFILTGRLVN